MALHRTSALSEVCVLGVQATETTPAGQRLYGRNWRCLGFRVWVFAFGIVVVFPPSIQCRPTWSESCKNPRLLQLLQHHVSSAEDCSMLLVLAFTAFARGWAQDTASEPADAGRGCWSPWFLGLGGAELASSKSRAGLAKPNSQGQSADDGTIVAIRNLVNTSWPKMQDSSTSYGNWNRMELGSCSFAV